MKNFMCTVQNADPPVINVVLITLIAVQYVIRHSIKRAL